MYRVSFCGCFFRHGRGSKLLQGKKIKCTVKAAALLTSGEKSSIITVNLAWR